MCVGFKGWVQGLKILGPGRRDVQDAEFRVRGSAFMVESLKRRDLHVTPHPRGARLLDPMRLLGLAARLSASSADERSPEIADPREPAGVGCHDLGVVGFLVLGVGWVKGPGQAFCDREFRGQGSGCSD